MIYVSPADIETYIGAEAFMLLCDRDDSGAVDTSDAEAACSNASSLADSYIARWLPITVAPQVLKQHVMDIAVYLLAGNNRTDDQRVRYEDALKWLRHVQAGDASLGIPPVDETGGTESRAPRICAQPRVMTRPKLAGIL
jgi:phage gp36-like protein